MPIVYTDSLARISAENLHGFFVGWPSPPSREAHLRILAASHHRVLAVDTITGNVVGFITAISDGGVLAAYIPLLEVLPEHQGGGIGSALVREMLERLRGHYMIDAICDAGVIPFYERCGLRGITGVALRDYSRLAELR